MSDKKNMPGVTGLMVLGIMMVVLGAVAIALPAIAGAAVVWIVGFLLLTIGIVQLVGAFREDSWSGRLPPLVLGIITVIAGGSVLSHPYIGLAVLTIILAVSFVAEGIWKIVASLSYRPATGWIGLMLSGLVTLVLGWMIWSQWPASGMWAIGVLVGVNLLMTGISILFLATTIKQVVNVASDVVDGAVVDGAVVDSQASSDDVEE